MADDLPENERERIGGNLPPEPIDNDGNAGKTLADVYAEQEQRVVELAKLGTDLPGKVDTAEVADRYVGVIKKTKAEMKAIDEKRKAENAPYTGKIADNNAHANALAARLSRMADVLSARLKAHYDEQEKIERERLAKEAEERRKKADEEAAAIAAAKEAGGLEAEMAEEREQKLSGDVAAAESKAMKGSGPMRSSSGTVGSRKGLDFRVKEYGDLDLNELRHSFTVDMIDKAIRAHVKQHKKTKPLKGVEIFETSSLNIR